MIDSLEEEVLDIFDIFQEIPTKWLTDGCVFSILVDARRLNVARPDVEKCLKGLVEAGYLKSTRSSLETDSYKLNDIQKVVSAALDKMANPGYDKA